MRQTFLALGLLLSVVLTGCGSAEERPAVKPTRAPANATSTAFVLTEIEDACSAVSAKTLASAGLSERGPGGECSWVSAQGGERRSLTTSIDGALPGAAGPEVASGTLADMRASGAEKIVVPGAAEAVLELRAIGGMQSVSVSARYRNVLFGAHLILSGDSTEARARQLVPLVVSATADVAAELRKRARDTSEPSAEQTQLVPDAAPDACSAVTAEHLAALGLEKDKPGACDWSVGQPGQMRTLHAFDLDGQSEGSAERSYERALAREEGARDVKVAGALRAVVVDLSDKRNVELKVLLLGQTGFARLTYRAPAPADGAALEKALLAAAGDVAAALDDVM